MGGHGQVQTSVRYIAHETLKPLGLRPDQINEME